MTMAFERGQWVEVRPGHDIPPMFRGGKPTRGRVYAEQDGLVEVWVPIGGADVDEHSQCVLYEPHQLVLSRSQTATQTGQA